MRITEDGHSVTNSDFVYEILYRYINPEASVAEPAVSKVSDIPLQFRIWNDYYRCLAECNKINNNGKV